MMVFDDFEKTINSHQPNHHETIKTIKTISDGFDGFDGWLLMVLMVLMVCGDGFLMVLMVLG